MGSGFCIDFCANGISADLPEIDIDFKKSRCRRNNRRRRNDNNNINNKLHNFITISEEYAKLNRRYSIIQMKYKILEDEIEMKNDECLQLKNSIGILATYNQT